MLVGDREPFGRVAQGGARKSSTGAVGNCQAWATHRSKAVNSKRQIPARVSADTVSRTAGQGGDQSVCKNAPTQVGGGPQGIKRPPQNDWAEWWPKPLPVFLNKRR